MSPEHAALLTNCNGMGKLGYNGWLAYEKRGEDYLTFDGLKAIPPDEWRPMSVAAIVAEYDRTGQVPVNWNLP